MRMILLLVFALLMSVPGITRLPPTDRDEARFVQATKQMVASGNYVDIRFQDQSRYKKPVGIYWIQAAAVDLFGQGETTPIWVYRLASTLGIVLAALGTYWTGRRLFGENAGTISAIVLVGILDVALEAHIAKTDAMLLACTVFAQGALAQIYLAARTNASPSRALPWIFWIAQGCAILIKGPLTPLASVLTIVALSALDRDWRWLKRLKAGRGILLTCLIVLPWLALITWRTGGGFLTDSVGKDLLAKVGTDQPHGSPPGYYFMVFSLFFWPFGMMAIGAGLHAMNRLKDHPALRFCLAWYIPFWLVFELIPTKLPHYTLPAYPALVLLIGWAATLPASVDMTPLAGWKKWLWRLAAFGLGAVTVVIVAAVLAGPLYVAGTFLWVGIPIAVAVCLATWLAFTDSIRTPGRRILGATVSAGVAYALTFGFLAPQLTPIWLSPRIADAVEKVRPCQTSSLAAVDYHEPSLVFLAGTGTLLTDTDGAAAALAADPACAMAVVPVGERAAVDSILAAAGRTSTVLSEIDGINYSSGKFLQLQLLRVTP